MPKIILPVQETGSSVTRPVVLEVVRQLCDETGISPETPIFFPDSIERGMQPGSSITPAKEINLTPNEDRIRIVVEENYTVAELSTTAVHQAEHRHVFRDDRLQLGIKPVYSTTDVVITFEYRANDKNGAKQWRDLIRTRVSMGRDIRNHKVVYHYLLPEEFIVILKEIHTMREAVDGYGETFEEFFTANASQRISWLTNFSGSQGAYGVAETQQRILGYFDISDNVPEDGSKDGDADTWMVSVSYKFQYEKPILCAMNYPLIIHNQLIDQKYRPDGQPPTPEDFLQARSLSSSMLGYFEKSRAQHEIPQGISIPDFDEFIPGVIPTSTKRVLTAMVTIDPLNPTVLMSLNDLGDFEFEPVILRFLKTEGTNIMVPGASVFVLSLYEDEQLCRHDALSVDADLNVIANRDLSLRKTYHLRLALATDLESLRIEALDRLRDDGEALQFILDAIDPTLKNTEGPNALGLIPDIMSGNYVSRAALAAAMQRMQRNALTKGNRQSYQFNTVMNFFIQIERNPSHALSE